MAGNDCTAFYSRGQFIPARPAAMAVRYSLRHLWHQRDKNNSIFADIARRHNRPTVKVGPDPCLIFIHEESDIVAQAAKQPNSRNGRTKNTERKSDKRRVGKECVTT